MPVVVTEYQKRPSALLSRIFTRLQRGSCLIGRGVETALLVMMQTSSAGPCTSQCTHHEPPALRLLLSNSRIPQVCFQACLDDIYVKPRKLANSSTGARSERSELTG